MKSINKSLEPILKSAVIESLKNYEVLNEDCSLGDLYMNYNKESETLTFFDDVEKELLQVQLTEKNVVWEEDFKKELRITAKAVLKELEQENLFTKEFIYKPFTVSLIDKNFIILEELIFIDDDNLKLEDDLWVDLDKKLDDFFDDLMK